MSPFRIGVYVGCIVIGTPIRRDREGAQRDEYKDTVFELKLRITFEMGFRLRDWHEVTRLYSKIGRGGSTDNEDSDIGVWQGFPSSMFWNAVW